METKKKRRKADPDGYPSEVRAACDESQIEADPMPNVTKLANETTHKLMDIAEDALGWKRSSVEEREGKPVKWADAPKAKVKAPKASAFPEQQAVPLQTGEKILYEDVACIFDNPFRPKYISIDEKKVATLVESIKTNGFLQPLPVRTKPQSKGWEFEIAFGHHRLRALQELNIDRVPIIVRAYTDEQMRRAFASEAHEHFGARKESVDMMVLQTIAHLKLTFPVPASSAGAVVSSLMGGWTEKQIAASFKRLAPVLCEIVPADIFGKMSYAEAMRIVRKVRGAMLAYFKLEQESSRCAGEVDDEVLRAVREEAWMKGRIVFAELCKVNETGDTQVYRADMQPFPDTGEIKPSAVRLAAEKWSAKGVLTKLQTIVDFDGALDDKSRIALARNVQETIKRLQVLDQKLVDPKLPQVGG